MAPITRKAASLSTDQARPGAVQNAFLGGAENRAREVSFQFPETVARAERELSDQPPSSYDDDEGPRQADNTDETESAFLVTSADHEDILHPLRTAADRVGRQVELFAEVLDRYNPGRGATEDERREMTVGLIEHYHSIASETAQKLHRRHGQQQRKLATANRRKQDGLRTHAEPAAMDTEATDEDQDLGPQTSVEDLEQWQQEAQTWDLLYRLVSVRYLDREAEPDSKPRLHRFSPETEIWGSFLHSSPLAREHNVIIEWLKDTADQNGEDIDTLVRDAQESAGQTQELSQGWLYTKESIKKFKRLNAWTDADASSRTLMSTTNERMVIHLDPDAPSREGHKLEGNDESFERAIWLGCLQMLRRGKSLADVHEWCQDRTEAWRALSMSGLHSHTASDDPTANDPSSVMLWRRMCFALARQGSKNDYERAVYGILCGDLESVEPVCHTWDDIIFAHCNALQMAHYASYLQGLHSQKILAGNLNVFHAIPLPADPSTAIPQLVATLKTDPRAAAQAQQPLKSLQAALIGNTFTQWIYQQGLSLSWAHDDPYLSKLIPRMEEQVKDANNNRYVSLEDFDNLRVLTHVLLILSTLGVDFGDDLQRLVIENTIVAYIGFLKLAGKEELIPLYCSHITGQRKYAVLCRSLIDVSDDEQRLLQLHLIRQHGMSIQEFVLCQTKYLLSDHTIEVEGYPAANKFKLVEPNPKPNESASRLICSPIEEGLDHIDRVDLLLMRSLEWFLLVDGLWSETFAYGTMIYMRFFKHVRLTAARILAKRLSSGKISRCKTRAILGVSSDIFIHALDHDEEDMDESQSGKRELLLRAMHAEARPFVELEMLSIALDDLETMAISYDQISNKRESKSTIWRQVLANEFHKAHLSVPPLLQGWLLVTQEDDAEFRILRETYLPEVVLAYLCVLHFVGLALTRDFLLESMDIAALVAAEHSDLMETFVATRRMEELVELFTVSSKTLLISTSEKPSTSRSKKMRAKGWTHDLWSVKSPA